MKTTPAYIENAHSTKNLFFVDKIQRIVFTISRKLFEIKLNHTDTITKQCILNKFY